MHAARGGGRHREGAPHPCDGVQRRAGGTCGVPSGQRHEICRGLHAEQNAIIQAARYGINIAGASIYINTQPCVVCAKMIINADIEEIIYQNPYPDELAMSMLEEAGIKLRVFEPANK